MRPTVSNPLLTKRGVAVYLDVSERTVDRLVESRALPAFRIGGHRRFRLDDLERFVAENWEARP